MISYPEKSRARYFHQLKRNVAQPTVRRFFLLCFLLAAVIAIMTGLSVFRSPSALAQSGSWTTKASMPTARVSLGVGVVNGTMYAVGGHNGAALTTVEAYDPVTDTWTTKAPMSTPRNGVAVGVVNGLLYAVGGDTDSGAAGFLNSVEAYDAITNTWSPKASMPTSRDILGVGVENGILYAMGGQANGVFLSTVEAYDPITNTWTTKAPMPNPRGFFGVGVINGIIYAAGGQGGGGAVATLEAYDPVTDTWATLSPMPTSRTAPAATVLNGILYVAGGEGGSCSAPCSVLEAYDPATNTWATVSPMPTGRGLLAAGVIGGSFYAVGGRDSLSNLSTVEMFTSEASPTPTPPVGPPQSWNSTSGMAHARFGHTATRLPDGRVLAVGGTDCSTGPNASAEIYDPVSGIWTPAASMNVAREFHTATLLPNGKVLVAGGFNNNFTVAGLASAELYDPATNTWSDTNAMAVGRYVHTATLLADGKVLVAGGDSSAAPALASSELYDPATGTWSSTGSLIQARDYHTATLLPNGKVLVSGGRGPGTVLDSAELYDVGTQTWGSAANLNERRAIHTATLLTNGQVLIAGGFNTSLSSAISSAELYNSLTNTWTPTASMGVSRYAHTATALLDGTVLVAGGFNGSYLVSAELYDPTSHLWMATGSLVSAREGHSGTLLLSGDVLAAGGYSDSCLNSAELYNGPTPTPATCVAPPANMVSWWPGDGDANDIQDGNNGAPQNGATFAPGKVAQAFSFDGVDDFVEVPNSANLNLTQALTIDAWVNPSVANQYGGIVEKTVGDHVNTQYLLDLEGGVVFFRLIIVPGVDHRTVHSNSVIPINEWTHIAGTWDGATMKLFINGVQQTETVAVTPPINSGPGPTLIGRLGDNIYRFAGLIDEVEIFNRALSTPEITVLYLADSAGKCKNNDQCPDDPNKTAPGICGCGVPDTDSDNDGSPDCFDACPTDPNKTSPGLCGCGSVDTDTDDDGTADCDDACPSDPNKINPGACGCGVADADTDHDGTPDCNDACPSDPNKINPGACGCGVPDADSDGDGIPNCHDNCSVSFNPDQLDTDGDGVGDVCTPFQYPAGGMFVIGDQVSLANGATVNFWGSQWSKNNPMSGGSAPNSFKGFENGSATAACGSNWTTGPGNSSSPPSTVPQYMALIVSSSIQKNGSVLSVDVTKIVVVRTNSGYGPSPGHAGTGQIVAILCVTNQSGNLFHQLWIPLDSLILPARVEWLDRHWLFMGDRICRSYGA